MLQALDRFFRITESGSTPAREVRAGIATFLTMAYILFVNPKILASAGMPEHDVVIATALASALATLCMGLFANYPFALAPGMGLNAYFAYGVVKEMGVDWRVALAAVFVEGVLFLFLSLGGIRPLMLNAIPLSIKTATMTGIGLFLAIIGLKNSGIVVDHPETLIGPGDLRDPHVLISLGGLLLIGSLMARRIQGAILIGVVVVSLTAWLVGLAPAPSGNLVTVPTLPKETLVAFDFTALFSVTLLPVILAFLFVDIFDTAGTLIGVGKLAGFVDERGELPRAGKAFASDAVGTVVGACLGTSTVTSYIESAAGVEEGGRTGLTAVIVALLFLLSLFFTPIAIAIPGLATGPALVIVGVLMMRGASELDWNKADEAIPAFLTITFMPFTFSIARGITAGIVSYVVLKLVAGRLREVHPVMLILAGLLVLFYGVIKGF